MFLAYARHEELKSQLIEELARTANPNDRATQNRICQSVGISLSEFSDIELSEISLAISRKWAQYHSEDLF